MGTIMTARKDDGAGAGDDLMADRVRTGGGEDAGVLQACGGCGVDVPVDTDAGHVVKAGKRDLTSIAGHLVALDVGSVTSKLRQ